MKPNEVGMTHKDYMDFAQQIREGTAFAVREQTIANALDMLIEHSKETGYAGIALDIYERELRKRVPLNV